MGRDRFWRDLGRAVCEAVFYRRVIFDPPPWPTRYRLFMRPRRINR